MAAFYHATSHSSIRFTSRLNLRKICPIHPFLLLLTMSGFYPTSAGVRRPAPKLFANVGKTTRHETKGIRANPLTKEPKFTDKTLMIFRIFSATCLLSLLLQTSGIAACGDAEKQSKTYQAFKACDLAKTAKASDDLKNAMAALNATGYCSSIFQTGKQNELLQKICTDPAGFACSQGNGKFMDSKCGYWAFDTNEAKETPSYVDVKCTYETSEAGFYQSHHSECKKDMTDSDCQDLIKAKHTDEILKIERDLAYTPQRVERVQKLYSRMKDKYLELIKNTTLIPADKKSLLLKQIKGTSLDLPPTADSPACTNTEPTGPASAIYNGGQKIEFCIGAISMVDTINDYELLHALAHELSHSIDPCTLEESNYSENGNPKKTAANAELGKSTYPGLLQCLRGGTGVDGCTGSILHCNSEKGIQDFVDGQTEIYDPGSERDHAKNQIMKHISATPDCQRGKRDPTQDLDNIADYRKDAEPISQIEESFSDFMGAEVTGRITSEDAAQGILNDSGKLDALESVASGFSRLHGGCRNENTNDEHPPGFIRTNRNVMGSKIFRESLGCTAAPSTPGAGQTCKGL